MLAVRIGISEGSLYWLYHLPFRPNWMKIYGQEYHRLCYLQVGWQDNDLPLFGKVLDVVVISRTPLVSVQVHCTEGINLHIQTYQIVPIGETKLLLLSRLHNKVVYYAHIFSGNRKLYITMRSMVSRE